jgi:hypothetical protein
MFSYRCRACGNFAYSSANAATVGRCPRCEGALAPAAPPPRENAPERVLAASGRSRSA